MAKDLYLKTSSGYESIGKIVDSPATTSDIPTKVSQLENDNGYLTGEDLTRQNLTSKLGFGNYEPNITWGSMTSGYTPIWGCNNTYGGGIHFAEKDEQTSMQIDGTFRQREGMYEVIDTSTIGDYTYLKANIDERFASLDVAVQNRYSKNDTYNKTEVNNLVNSALSGSMHYWNGGVVGGSPGSTQWVAVTRLYPPSAKLNDSVIVIDKDSSGRGTLTITWYLVTDIDDENVQLTCQKNYYSYDNPSSGTTLGTIGGSTFSMGGSLGLKTVNGNSLVGSGNIAITTPSIPSYINSTGLTWRSNYYITNIFAYQFSRTGSYSSGGDYMLDISIPSGSTGSGTWYPCVSMVGVNSTTGDYSTQFVTNASMKNSTTIRVWFHCLFGSNSSSSIKLYCTVIAIKYY